MTSYKKARDGGCRSVRGARSSSWREHLRFPPGRGGLLHAEGSAVMQDQLCQASRQRPAVKAHHPPGTSCPGVSRWPGRSPLDESARHDRRDRRFGRSGLDNTGRPLRVTISISAVVSPRWRASRMQKTSFSTVCGYPRIWGFRMWVDGVPSTGLPQRPSGRRVSKSFS